MKQEKEVNGTFAVCRSMTRGCYHFCSALPCPALLYWTITFITILFHTMSHRTQRAHVITIATSISHCHNLTRKACNSAIHIYKNKYFSTLFSSPFQTSWLFVDPWSEDCQVFVNDRAPAGLLVDIILCRYYIRMGMRHVVWLSTWWQSCLNLLQSWCQPPVHSAVYNMDVGIILDICIMQHPS